MWSGCKYRIFLYPPQIRGCNDREGIVIFQGNAYFCDMKKGFTILAAALLAVAALMSVSCKKDNGNQKDSFKPQSLEDYYGTMWVTGGWWGAKSKAIFTFFEGGAREYILLDGETISGQYVMSDLEFVPESSGIRFRPVALELASNNNWDPPAGNLLFGQPNGNFLTIYELDEGGNIKEETAYAVERAKDIDLSSLKFAEEFVPEAIDLGDMYTKDGIRTHVKWAKWNLGAYTESGYGLHYAWGELEQKLVCSSSNYLYNEDVKELPLDRDAAAVRLGNGWRMPTGNEIQALANTKNDHTNFSWTYVTISGVPGWRIKRLTGGEGIKGNSIFLPLAQYIKEYGLYTGSLCGYYWSSTSWNKLSTAYTLCLHSDQESDPTIVGDQRKMGDSIRPVTDE